MKVEFRIAICKADFNTAEKIYKHLPREHAVDTLIDVAMSGNILAYGFACKLITANNNAENHLLASNINIAACFLDGAYALAFYHAKMAASLSEKIIYHEHLLFFNEIPEKLLADIETKTIVERILRDEPNNFLAMEIRKRL